MAGLALLFAVVAASAGAQESSERTGVVAGAVYDSLRSAPLAGAFVFLESSTAAATTDARGRFELRNLPAGRGMLTVVHPALDSLGIPELRVGVDVQPGGRSEVRVGVPSFASVWDALCDEEATFAAGGGIVFGSVRDVEHQAMLTGARVLVEWLVVGRDIRGRVAGEVQSAVVTTDSIGVYRVCGVPPATAVTVQAFAGAAATRQLDLRLGDPPLARRDLSMTGAPAGPVIVRGDGENDEWPADLVAPARPVGQPAAEQMTPNGPAILAGTVRTQGGAPLQGALVTVDGMADEVRTGEDGSFVLAGLPAGSRMIGVRVVGYAPSWQPVDLLARDTTRFSVEMLPITALAEMRVRSQRVRRDAEELIRRREMGFGHHYSAEELARGSTMRSFLDQVPGTRTTGAGRSVFEYYILMVGTRGECQATLYIDGYIAQVQELASYHPSDLYAMEVYTRPSTAPHRYLSLAEETPCGVVLVWTRHYFGAR